MHKDTNNKVIEFRPIEERSLSLIEHSKLSLIITITRLYSIVT
jgi:hypothetical protein